MGLHLLTYQMRTICLPLKRNKYLSQSVFYRTRSYSSKVKLNRGSVLFSILVKKCPKQFFSKSISSETKLHKPSKNEFKRLFQIAEPEKWKLSGAICLLFISSSVTMAVPYCVGKLIDMISSSSERLKENLTSVCQILFGIFALGALANFGRVYLMSVSSYRVINSLRKQTYRSVLQQETAFFDKSSTGDLINRLSSDASTVGMSVTYNISDGMRSAFSLIVGSSLMIYTSPQLAALGLATVAPVALVAVFYGKRLKKNSESVQDSLAAATQVAEERISNIRTVQAFAKLNKENQLYGIKINDVLHFATKESFSRAIFFGLTAFSGNAIILSVLYYGGLMMSENQISVGGLASFLMYSAYVGISVVGLSTFYSDMMRGLGASTRLWQLIDRQPLIPTKGGVVIPNLNGNIEFHDIKFSYPTRPNSLILSDFNLSVPAGSVYAVVGPSGCGKSTLGALLLRFYDCDSGSITIDGQDITTLDLQWLRTNIGLVSQEPILFSFTIRENITYGAEEPEKIEDGLVEDVLEKANALDFVEKFPSGLDTVVGERGVMLSGGQRQRITIARALLKNPKILILDEATSALDAESEFLVQSALEELMKNRTVITIAHRLSTIRKADKIIVLENGGVVEMGSYDELLRNQRTFSRLVQRQNLK